MSSIKVSACIITYNHEAYLRKCLEGAIHQKVNFDYEIVIGEDRSTDATLKICEEYADKYPDIVKLFKRDTNLGMTGNWMDTIKNCQGKYIALCEGDDYWTDVNKLQKQFDFMESDEAYSGCFHNVMVMDEVDKDFKSKLWRTYSKDSFDLVDTFSRTALFHTCSFMFRNNLVKFPDWFKDVKSADMSLFALIASKGKLKLLQGDMGVYRKNETGVTSNMKLVDYHNGRVQLMTFFKQHFDAEFEDHINRIITFHQEEIKSPKQNKIKTIFKTIKTKLK